MKAIVETKFSRNKAEIDEVELIHEGEKGFVVLKIKQINPVIGTVKIIIERDDFLKFMVSQVTNIRLGIKGLDGPENCPDFESYVESFQEVTEFITGRKAVIT